MCLVIYSATARFLLLVLSRFCLDLLSVSRNPVWSRDPFLFAALVIAALELMSRNIFCGSVRIVYAIIYTLFLVGQANNPSSLC